VLGKSEFDPRAWQLLSAKSSASHDPIREREGIMRRGGFGWQQLPRQPLRIHVCEKNPIFADFNHFSEIL